MTDKPMMMGLAWYSPETWQELCKHPEAKIGKSYSEYLRDYDDLAAGFTAKGLQVEKVPVDLALMTKWCHAHGYEINSKGRTAFVAALSLARDAGKDVMTMPFSDNTRSVQ